MPDKPTTTPPENNLAPHSKPPAPIAGWARIAVGWVAAELVGQKGVAIFSAGGSAMTGLITFLLGQDSNQPYNLLIRDTVLILAGTFLALFLLGLVLRWLWGLAFHGKRETEREQQSPQIGEGKQPEGQPAPTAGQIPAANVEQQNRTKELEDEKAALGKARDEAVKAHEEATRKIARLEHNAVGHSLILNSRIEELDKYRWLHEIAENHRKFIDTYVRVLKCEIGEHDLVNELYVEFKFTILNASVYAVEIGDEIKGDVYLNSRQLSRDRKMTKDSTRHFNNGESGSYVVRQWLSTEEVKDFLGGPNKAGKFRLKGLEIVIRGGPPESEVIPKTLGIYGQSVSGTSLWELYQELQIETQQATFTAYWNFEQGIQKNMTVPAFYGFLINMRVHIVNPRPTQITLRGCRLTAKIKGKEYAADAETGAVIYQDRIMSKGEQILRGEKFENLNSTYLHPRIIEAKDEYNSGHLQFILRDAPQFGDGEEKWPISATLSISDTSGETHRTECQLSYVTSYKL
jgi:hypothetical protein